MQHSNSSETISSVSSATSLYDFNSSTPVQIEERLTINLIQSPSAPESNLEEGQDVIEGLSNRPKSLPPKYFYDELGSQLFEQICELPEYYLTRTEAAILQQYAGAIAQLTGPCELVELGSGSATKTRLLLDAYQDYGYPLTYIPIDVSGSMLTESAHQLLATYSDLRIHGLVSTYELALAQLPPTTLPTRMLCFIGSSLGNLTPEACDEFMTQVAAALQPGEYFLLGVDLHKSDDLLEAAYNDSQGVTAKFNLNMLHHLNWRFQGNFDSNQFEHVAFYNQAKRQIEIYLKSLTSQVATLRALNLTVNFAADEMLLSEISRKFDLQALTQTLQDHGLKPLKTFTDDKQWFGLLLCERQDNQPEEQ